MVDERRRARGGDRGAVAVELALLLPFVLAVLAGVIDFGLAFNAQIQLSQAAQAGARAAALNFDHDTVVARAQGASPGLDLTPDDVDATGCDPTTRTATVTVSHEIEIPVPIPSLGSTLDLNQKAVTPCTPVS